MEKLTPEKLSIACALYLRAGKQGIKKAKELFNVSQATLDQRIRVALNEPIDLTFRNSSTANLARSVWKTKLINPQMSYEMISKINHTSESSVYRILATNYVINGKAMRGEPNTKLIDECMNINIDEYLKSIDKYKPVHIETVPINSTIKSVDINELTRLKEQVESVLIKINELIEQLV